MNDFLTQKIIGAAIEVHKNLGCGLLESIYEEALCHELDLRGIKYHGQVEFDVVYKGTIIKGQRIDLLVEESVVVEIKPLSKLREAAVAQTLSYLKATGLKRGLLINFGATKLVDGIRRLSRCSLWLIMKIAKIVKSNSHLDYIGRVIDALDVATPPNADDCCFAQFVSLPVQETQEIIGVIYNSILVNPEYSNFGPRLSPKPELRGFSPDYLNEQGILVGILLLGSRENGKAQQGVPRRIVPCGQDVLKMEPDEVIKFHTDQNGSLQIHYYSQIVAHAGLFAVSLIEAIVEQLCENASDEDKNRLNVLKHALAWQRTVGGMRL